MFNLLPPNEKQNILKEYAYRKLILLCLFLAALGLIGVTSLLPSYLLSRARIAELSSDVARSKGVVQAEELQNQIKIVSLANSKIQLLVDVIDHMSARDVFKSVIDKRGNGVRISGMMYKRGGKDSERDRDNYEHHS